MGPHAVLVQGTEMRSACWRISTILHGPVVYMWYELWQIEFTPWGDELQPQSTCRELINDVLQ